VSKQHILFGYVGVENETSIEILNTVPDDFQYRKINARDSDTINYWFKPFLESTDSLVFKVTSSDYQDTLITRFKDQTKDSLKIKRDDKLSLLLEKRISLQLNTPIEAVDSTLFSLVDKDTVTIPFKVEIDKNLNTVNVAFDAAEANTYQLQVLPNGIADFYGSSNDTLDYKVRTRELSDFGDLVLTVTNAQSYPIIVQLLDREGKIKYEQTQSEKGVLTFKSLDPRSYKIRVIIDLNANGIWDTGSYLDKRQPEPVKFYPTEIEIRANSEIYQTFTLN